VSNHLSDIPEIALWLSRIAGDPATRERLLLDPVLFAYWYATAGDIITWPAEGKAIIEEQRAKKLSFERTMALLSKMNAAVAEEAGVEYARRVLEGHALHFWLAENYLEFKTQAEIAQRTFESIAMNRVLFEELGDTKGMSRLGRGVAELTEVLQLNSIQRNILVFAICCASAAELRTLFDGLARGFKTEAPGMWANLFGCKEAELAEALSPDGMLRVSGLLSPETNSQLPCVSSLWVDLLVKSTEGLLPVLVQDSAALLKAGAGIPARLAPEDLELGACILKNADTTGVNLLLYGAQNYDKRKAVHDLVAGAGKKLYRLQAQRNARQEMPSIAFVAQRLLAKQDPNAVLFIDKPSEILERTPSAFMMIFFGMERDVAHVEPFDELMLSANPIPTVWCGAGTESLPAETVARFVFHAPLQRATRTDRRELLESQLAALDLSAETREQLLALEEVSALQLQTAIRAAALSGAKDSVERELALVQAVRRSLNALQREAKARRKKSYTEYSLDFVNVAGRFQPNKLVKALRTHTGATLCLYGIPGTGKTEFAYHIAESLGRPLLVKSASELLTKWVGDAEKNIAAMFHEAEAAEAVLLLDEGDSFLRDRQLAKQEHEVTRTNELLNRMEEFEGIFILSTNLFRDLDAAALRRFTFKLEFRALSPDQKWKLFLRETGLADKTHEISASQREAWSDALIFMNNLTPGDFETVKRQCVLLEETLAPDEWLAQLKIEQDLKRNRLISSETAGRAYA
jgi:DNA replication protein DnaC